MTLADSLADVDDVGYFTVEIDGFASASFHKCSDLEVELAVHSLQAGDAAIPNKSLGRPKFTPITLERGARADNDFYIWVASCVQGTVAVAGAPAGLTMDAIKRNLDIVQRDRAGNELKRYTVYGAMPSKWKAGAWDAASEEKQIEMITLEYDAFDRAA